MTNNQVRRWLHFKHSASQGLFTQAATATMSATWQKKMAEKAGKLPNVWRDFSAKWPLLIVELGRESSKSH